MRQKQGLLELAEFNSNNCLHRKIWQMYICHYCSV